MGPGPVAAPGGSGAVAGSPAMLGAVSSPRGIYHNLWYEKISFSSIPSLLSPHHG